jgi:hypothetical protein
MQFISYSQAERKDQTSQGFPKSVDLMSAPEHRKREKIIMESIR